MNLKRYQNIFRLASLVAAACFWCAGLAQSSELIERFGTVSARFDASPLAAKMLENALAASKEPPRATLWKQENTVTASADTGSAAANLLTVHGNISDALPFSLSRGHFPEVGDTTGCVLDESTAYKLFKSFDALGRKLSVNGIEYEVSGIFSSPQRAIAVQSPDDAGGFTGLELSFPDGKVDSSRANEFIFAAGLPTPNAVIDMPFQAECAQTLSLLPAWLIGAMLFFCTMSNLKKARLSNAPYWAFAAAALALILFAVRADISFPDRFVPSRWSDFSYWPSLGERIGETINQARLARPSSLDIAFDRYFLVCALWTLIAAILFAVSLKGAKRISQTAYFVQSGAYIGAVFCSCCLLAYKGFDTGNPPALWLAYPLCLLPPALSAMLPRPVRVPRFQKGQQLLEQKRKPVALQTFDIPGEG